MLSYLGISCTSNPSSDMAIRITCEYDNAIYRGYRVYVQNERETTPTYMVSTESGMEVTFTGSISGNHLVFVYPVWRSIGKRLNGKLGPIYKKIYKFPLIMNDISTTKGILFYYFVIIT